jgi:hypothetical protein
MDADALLTNSVGRGRRSRVVPTPRCWRQVREKQGFSLMMVTIKPVTKESAE